MPPIPPSRKNSVAAPKTADNPLPLQNTLADIVALRRTPAAADALAALVPAPPEEPDVLLDASYEYVKSARAAMAVGKNGSVEAEGEKMEKVRSVLEDVVRGLEGAPQ